MLSLEEIVAYCRNTFEIRNKLSEDVRKEKEWSPSAINRQGLQVFDCCCYVKNIFQPGRSNDESNMAHSVNEIQTLFKLHVKSACCSLLNRILTCGMCCSRLEEKWWNRRSSLVEMTTLHMTGRSQSCIEPYRRVLYSKWNSGEAKKAVVRCKSGLRLGFYHTFSFASSFCFASSAEVIAVSPGESMNSFILSIG